LTPIPLKAASKFPYSMFRSTPKTLASETASLGAPFGEQPRPSGFRLVAFPHGVYDPEILRPHRKDISSERPFMLSYDGKTVKDNEYLGFTFDRDDFVACRRKLREGTGQYNSKVMEDGIFPREKLPKEERWSARHFLLDKIFEPVIIGIENKVAVPWYYNISSWDNYCNFLSSEERKNVERPHPIFMSYHEWNEIGVDDED